MIELGQGLQGPGVARATARRPKGRPIEDASEAGHREIKRIGGQGGIRTHGGLAPTLVFKTSAFNRSATCPRRNAR